MVGRFHAHIVSDNCIGVFDPVQDIIIFKHVPEGIPFDHMKFWKPNHIESWVVSQTEPGGIGIQAFDWMAPWHLRLTIKIVLIHTMQRIFFSRKVELLKRLPSDKNTICIVDHIIRSPPGFSSIIAFIDLVSFKICIAGYHVHGRFTVIVPVNPNLA